MTKRRTKPLFPTDEDTEEAVEEVAKKEIWPEWFDALSDPVKVKRSLWAHIKGLDWEDPLLTSRRLKESLVPNLRAAYGMYGENDGWEFVTAYQKAAYAAETGS